MPEIKDSGERTEFETGAVRDMHEGKGRFDLLPMCVLMRLAQHYEAGAKKYSDRNWEKGIPAHSFADSAMRHLVKYLDGWDDEDHLIAAIWNLCGLAWTEEKKPEMMDIPARLDHNENDDALTDLKNYFTQSHETEAKYVPVIEHTGEMMYIPPREATEALADVLEHNCFIEDIVIDKNGARVVVHSNNDGNITISKVIDAFVGSLPLTP